MADNGYVQHMWDSQNAARSSGSHWLAWLIAASLAVGAAATYVAYLQGYRLIGY